MWMIQNPRPVIDASPDMSDLGVLGLVFVLVAIVVVWAVFK